MPQTEMTDARPWEAPIWKSTKGKEGVLLYLVAIHVLTIVGLVLYPIPSLPVFLVALGIALPGGLGTTVCYHRSLSHRTVKLNKVLEHFLIFWTMFNGSGAPISWSANHRLHHAKSDTDEDVSSPRHGGFWWAHLRWLYQWEPSSMKKWCPDMMQTRYTFWVKVQTPLVLISLCFGYFLFGWAGFFWLGAIRMLYCLHMQCFVNSLLHLKPGLPEGVDSSQNIWWLGPLQVTAWGENWHGNHHAKPSSACFSRHWWQVDIGWYVIRGLERFGLASNVRR